MKQFSNIKIQFDKLLAETPKAYRLRFRNIEFWIPKALCRNMITNNKLGGNVVIPAFKYMEITGEEVDEGNAETIIEKHIPIPISPVNIIADESLTK